MTNREKVLDALKGVDLFAGEKIPEDKGKIVSEALREEFAARARQQRRLFRGDDT